MGFMSPLKDNQPHQSILNAIKEISGIQEEFIEKDWLAVQASKVISSLSNPKISFVFSGGTAPSKARKIIQRLSEDCYFRLVLHSADGMSRSQIR